MTTTTEILKKLNDEARFRPVYWGSERNLFTQAAEALEAQQAQIKGLVEALKYALVRRVTIGKDERIPVEGIRALQAALSTLPADFLERERKREAVIWAAKEWVRLWETNADRVVEFANLVRAIKALEVVENGKEYIRLTSEELRVIADEMETNP